MTIFKTSKNKGFTIIELMIATSVFAIVLVIAATGIMTIGRLYYKGITSARTQETTRSVINNIASTIQFSGHSMILGGNPSGVQSVCFGYDRYTYLINSKVTGPDTLGLRHDRRDSLNNCDPIGATDVSGNPNGTELLPDNNRLLDFRVTTVNSSTYRINVKIAYGDNDLLTHYPPNATDATDPTAPANTAQCRPGIAASSFCGVSELESIVTKRVK